MVRSVFMEDLDAFTYRERVADGAPVLIPVGSIEQHGPHMPLSVDVLLSKAMAGAVAEHTGSLVAAPIVYGYKSQQRSGGGNHLTGSTSLDAATVIATAKSLVLELARHGVRKIAFVNGHYENYQFLYEGVDLALGELRLAGTQDVRVMLMSYWDFVDDDAIAELYPDGFPGWDLEHGGVLETSLMLLLHPALVAMDRVADIPPAVLPTYDLLPARPEITPPSGCLSSGAAATADKGQVLLDRASAGMVTAIRSEFGM
ncbi:creatininase [Georgenia yuyongxinii]|uniref:Creatininase n=1 Tax=Georgenia yuyongxinii TaxID=2589797 RepID=A0A552WJN9_9MICO|nr:creatininase [Georgenia yuyongxinii]TRW42970.1 creatininase [Georgenia yuyongxinii]